MGNTMDPERFREKLQQILNLALENDGKISTAQIQDFFRGEPLTEEQMKLVYDFVLSKKIIVDGYTKESGETEENGANQTEIPWSPEEQRWLETYMEDVDAIRPEKEGEWIQLLRGLAEQDTGSSRRLTELLLPAVVELAKSMYTEGVHLADIVQEGSLGLVLAVEELQAEPLLAQFGSEEDRLREAVHRSIRKSVRENILAMLEEQTDVHVRDRKFVEKVEDLKEGVSTLKEEYGRKVYLDEVADFMSISEEEAMNILHLAGEEVPEEDAGE